MVGTWITVPDYSTLSPFFLERLLGGLDVFLPYIRDYVDTFMGRSIDTTIWKEHLYGYWSKTENGEEKVKLLDSVDWDVSDLSIFLFVCYNEFSS